MLIPAPATRTIDSIASSGNTTGDILLNLSAFTNSCGGSWSVSVDAFNVYVHYNAPLTPTVIPEPSMAILMITGGLILYVRRRQRPRR